MRLDAFRTRFDTWKRLSPRVRELSATAHHKAEGEGHGGCTDRAADGYMSKE
jgi:hypothetical protein